MFARKIIPLFEPDSPSVQNEIRAIRKLCNNTHKNVVNVFEVGRFRFHDNQYAFIDMQLCDLDLDQYMKSARVVNLVHEDTTWQFRLRELQICNIMRQISLGIAFIHGKKEVHRDIKPKNSITLAYSYLNLVLYSCKDMAWKVADFGLTSEGNSESLRSTEAARGTPGYRPPELLQRKHDTDMPRYNNAVDIWAMGCVLYELIFGVKLFLSDLDVLNHYQDKETFTVIVDPRYKSARTLSNAIRDTLQMSPQSRPKAKALVDRFSRLYKSIAIDTTQSSINEDSVMLDVDSEPDELDSESFSSLPLYQLSDSDLIGPEVVDITDWHVIDTVVNKLNTRIVVSSRDDEQFYFRSRLFDTSSGELIWEKQETWTTPKQHPASKFSADGKYLGVFFDGCVEVLDVHSKPPKLVQSCNVPDAFSDIGPIVQAIAITRNGKGIAVSCVRSGSPAGPLLRWAQFGRQIYQSQHSASGKCGVDVINTGYLSDVALTYTPDGCRLYLLGFSAHRTAVLGPPDPRTDLVIYCWDTQSRRMLHENTLAEGTHITVDSPLAVMHSNDNPCIVFSLGQGSSLRVFLIYSCDGSEVIGRYSTDGMIHVVTNGGVLFLKSDKYFKKWDESKKTWLPDRERRITDRDDNRESRYIWKWDGKASEPECCGVIPWRGLPPFHKVKAICEEKYGLALILDNERFVHLERK